MMRLGGVFNRAQPAAGFKFNMQHFSAACIAAKPGALVQPRTLFADLESFVTRVQAKGGYVLAPKLVVPSVDPQNRQMVNFYEALQTKDFFEDHIRHILGTQEEGYPSAPLLSLMVVGPKTVRETIDGREQELDFYTWLREFCIGPTYLTHNKETEGSRLLAPLQSLLRFLNVIDRGRSCFLPGEIDPILNNWHCSESEADARRELAAIYPWQQIRNFFEFTNAQDERTARSRVLDESRRFSRPEFEQFLTSIPTNNAEISDLARRICASRTGEQEYQDFSLETANPLLRLARDFFKPATENLTFNPNARIYVVMGLPGSGKTSVVKGLRNLEMRPDFDIIPLLVTGSADSETERSVSDRAFEKKMEWMAGCESGPGGWYGVDENEILNILFNGRKGVLVAGPEIFWAVAHFVRKVTGRRDLVLPVYIDVSQEKAVGRLKNREKEEQRPAKERISQLDVVAKKFKEKGLSPGTPGLQVISNEEDGQLAAAVSQLGNYINAGNTLDARLFPGFVQPANQPLSIPELVTARMLMNAVAQIKATIAGGSLAPLAERDAGANMALKNVSAVSRLLYEIYRLRNSHYVLPGDKTRYDYLVNYLQRHVIDTVTAIFEWRLLREQLKHPDRPVTDVGGVSAGLDSRAPSNLTNESRAVMAEVIDSLPLEEQVYLALLHDIGKLEESDFSHWHPEITAMLLRKHQAALMFGFEENRRPLARLVMKYHHYLGDTYQGRASFRFIHEMLSNPELAEQLFLDVRPLPADVEARRKAKEVKAKNYNQVQKNVKTFLDMLFFLTVTDIASLGNLGPLGLNHYAKLKKALEKILLQPAEVSQEITGGIRYSVKRHPNGEIEIIKVFPPEAEQRPLRITVGSQDELSGRADSIGFNASDIQNINSLIATLPNKDNILAQVSRNEIFDEGGRQILSTSRRISAMVAPAVLGPTDPTPFSLEEVSDDYVEPMLNIAVTRGIVNQTSLRNIGNTLEHFDLPFIDFSNIAKPDEPNLQSANPALMEFLKRITDFYWSGLSDKERTQCQAGKMIEVVLVDKEGRPVSPPRGGKPNDGYRYLRKGLLGDTTCPITLERWGGIVRGVNIRPKYDPNTNPDATERILVRMVLSDFTEDGRYY